MVAFRGSVCVRLQHKGPQECKPSFLFPHFWSLPLPHGSIPLPSTAILNDGDPSSPFNQPAYKRPSRHLYFKARCLMPKRLLSSAPLREEKVIKKKKDFTRCSTSHKWQSLIESHVEPSHTALPRCTHCSREQLLRAYTH